MVSKNNNALQGEYPKNSLLQMALNMGKAKNAKAYGMKEFSVKSAHEVSLVMDNVNKWIRENWCNGFRVVNIETILDPLSHCDFSGVRVYYEMKCE